MVSSRRRRASALVASRWAMPMWLWASRAARSATTSSTPSRRWIELGDVGGARNAEPYGAHPRPDGRDEVGVAGRAQDPDGAFRRFFERLEEDVGCAFAHAVGVFDDHHAVVAGGWRELGARDEAAHFFDRDDHALGAEDGEVGVRARFDLPPRREVAFGVARTEQGGRECECEVGPPGAGRPGDEPRMRHRAAVARVRRCLEDGNGFSLTRQVVPHCHCPRLSSAADVADAVHRRGQRRVPMRSRIAAEI